MLNISNNSSESRYAGWHDAVLRYAHPDLSRSIWMMVNTFVPYFVLWAVMLYSVHISYWLTLLLAFPTAGFMIRSFIIFHDAGHGSFFKNGKANDVVGFITGVLNFTPYYKWRREHAIHHATASDLDGRGIGDVKTMTVEEYLAAPWWRKVAYRIFRNPFVMFTIGSFSVFAFVARIPGKNDKGRELHSVWWTNLALAILITGLCLLVGWRTYLLVQLPVLLLGTSVGVWLFYVQHNFDPTYWERHNKWEFVKAGFEGSSYYKLPKVLQWFSGNIGFHHIHHLNPKIPNYKLPECYRQNPVFQVPGMTIAASLSSLHMRLYDEKRKMMVGWSGLKVYRTRKSTLTARRQIDQ